MNRIKKFISDWKNGILLWHSNNFEKVQLGEEKQYKWYTCSLSSVSNNFTFYNWFFGFSISWAEFIVLPTIRFNIPKKHNKKEDFILHIEWLICHIGLNIGHWIFCPFKGYKTELEIENYKEYLKEINDIKLETVE